VLERESPPPAYNKTYAEIESMISQHLLQSITSPSRYVISHNQNSRGESWVEYNDGTTEPIKGGPKSQG
jgi:hypothetical protein